MKVLLLLLLLTVSGCDNISVVGQTGEYKEETRISSRYQLLGRLDEGDVSLMIQNLREEDAGRYGCRVGIPGWFNDEKHHVDLTVERGLPPSPPPETQTPTERPDSAGTTADLMTTENLLTSCTDSSTTAERQQEGSNLLVVLGCVLFLLVVLVTAGGLFIMARRWRQPKLPQQDQVHFSTTASTLQLQHQDSVVENVYQIDGGAEGGDYEVCP
ncbi:uncharacterized protein V3H82_020904 isoform 2-T2 [Fundulus diaphanus]